MKTEKRGGARKGSGAKPKYDEPTTTISIRVPVSRVDQVKIIVEDYLNQFKNEKS